MDVFGDAVFDYQQGRYTEDLITFSSIAEEDVIPLPYLFRDFKAMPILEQKALNICNGKVLDIGSGAGSHSLYLQKKGMDVTALDSSKGALKTCKLRGIKNCVHADILDFEGEQFDTLLMLMNGIGLAGELKNLSKFFTHLKKLLRPNGQILLDSSDIIYLFDEDEDGGRWLPESAKYYGEVSFTLSYKGLKGKPFSWLYLDQNTLHSAALSNGFNCEIVSLGEHYDYLARLIASK
ncbi:class I SAM-dependent methyltransferase [Maribacter sp. 2308TA10-17]|uniref:class I SAM-dependent methyltransferase n=1 Tax=Maribacter sp. 2308TA10-17 TaxID=3386276 RepID=UPI0039BCD4FF